MERLGSAAFVCLCAYTYVIFERIMLELLTPLNFETASEPETWLPHSSLSGIFIKIHCSHVMPHVALLPKLLSPQDSLFQPRQS